LLYFERPHTGSLSAQTDRIPATRAVRSVKFAPSNKKKNENKKKRRGCYNYENKWGSCRY